PTCARGGAGGRPFFSAGRSSSSSARPRSAASPLSSANTCSAASASTRWSTTSPPARSRPARLPLRRRRTSSGRTSAKFAALVVLVGASFMFGGEHGASWDYLTAPASGPITIGAMGLALVSVLWAYDGWGDLSFAAGEVKNPQRNLPRAIILGTLALIGIYVMTNVAYVYVNSVA